MKKTVLTLTALLLAAALLAGCGGEEPTPGVVSPVTEASATEAPATEPPAEEKDVSIGRIEGGVYTNTYTGYGCTLDSSWVFYSAEELQEMPADTQAMFEGSEMEEYLKNAQQIMDMKADNVNTMASINVLYQKLDMQSRLTYAVMNDEQILDATLMSKDLMIQSYEQAGIHVTSMDKEKATFLGEDRWVLRTEASVEGVPYYIVQVFDFRLGEYSVTMTLGSFVEDNTADLLAMFYKVD